MLLDSYIVRVYLLCKLKGAIISMKKLKIYKILAAGLVCSIITTSINYPVYAKTKISVYLENEANDSAETEIEKTIEHLVEPEFYSNLEKISEIEEKEIICDEETKEYKNGESIFISESNESNEIERDTIIEEIENNEIVFESDDFSDMETIAEENTETIAEENTETIAINNDNLDAVKSSTVVASGNYGENLGSNVKYKLTGNETDGYTLSLTGEGKMCSLLDQSWVDQFCPWISYRKYIKHISIGEGITNIGGFAFYQCGNVEDNIKIPSTVTIIEKSAFHHCSGLTGIMEIPKSVKKIEKDAFYRCKNLTQIVFSPTIEYIAPQAFYNCFGLVGTIEIPQSITYLGENAFDLCTGIERIINNSEYPLNLPSSSDTWWIKLGDPEKTHITTITSGTAIRMPMDIKIDGITYKVINDATSSENGTVELIDGSGYVSTNLSIPAVITDEVGNSYDVIKIANEAFKDCIHITGTITLPSTLKTIGDSAFWGCKGLTGDLVIPDGVTTIEADAFWDCENLNGTLSLPNSLTSLGDAAFENCEKLSGILSIPSGLSVIPESAFAFDFGFSGTLEIPENITSIGGSAFESCTGITDLVIKSASDGIEDYAFSKCSSLNKVYISSNVNYIGEQVFYDTEKECNLNIIIYADESSYAYKWAIDNGFYCVNAELWDNQIYEIRFESDGDSITNNTKLVVNNGIYGTLPQATKTNYDFLGWYTSDGNKITQDTIVNLSENQTLYAKWMEIKGFEFTEEIKDSRLGNTRGSINISLKKTSWVYTGSEIQPSITVNYVYQEYDSNNNLGKSKKQKLVQNVDYTISYENNINVSGEHKIIVKGIGDFYGEITKTFTIQPKQAKSLTIEPIADWSGTFEEISEKIGEFVIIHDGMLTVESSNYDISISKGVTKKGDPIATVTITAKENYTGIAPKAKTTFNLVDNSNKLNASNLVLTVSSKPLTYTGKMLKPKVIVTDKEGKKISSKNYQLIYKNNVNAGNATVYVVGKNDYYGTSDPISFTINPKDFNKVKITKLSKVMFRSSVDDIHPIVMDGKVVLKEGIDYSVAFQTNDGLSLFGAKSKKITVTITNLSSNYTRGTKTTSLIITPRNIKNTMTCVVSVDKEQLGEGNAHPLVIVKYSGKTLIEGEDYTLVYSGNAKKGSVKVIGKGDYVGTRTIKFS